MIISHRGPRAAAKLILLLFALLGDQVDASHSRRQSDNNPIVPKFFGTTWTGDAFQGKPVALDQTFSVTYTVASNIDNNTIQNQANQQKLFLVLLWTNSTSSSPTPDDTFEVIDVKYSCTSSLGNACNWEGNSEGSAKFALSVNPQEQGEWTQNQGNFFLGFATTVSEHDTIQYCESFSPFFQVAPPDGQSVAATTSLAAPSGVLAVTSTTQMVTSSGNPLPSTAAPSASPTSSGIVLGGSGAATTIYASTVTASGTPSSTITVTPSSVPTSQGQFSATKSTKSGGLPTGAIVGIAVGGLAVLLVLLGLAFFCLRRRRRVRNSPEQVLLRHGHHGSRDIIAEKELSTLSTSAASGGMFGSMMGDSTRPESYDHLSASAPYNGPAGPGGVARSSPRSTPTPIPIQRTNPIPQRTPTVATQTTVNTNISRGFSDATNRTRERGYSDATSRGGVFSEPYSDVPIYGETRHSPQVYQGTLQAPFLSEPGMTDEELVRLEEEERRIDAAIAEAERRR